MQDFDKVEEFVEQKPPDEQNKTKKPLPIVSLAVLKESNAKSVEYSLKGQR